VRSQAVATLFRPRPDMPKPNANVRAGTSAKLVAATWMRHGGFEPPNRGLEATQRHLGGSRPVWTTRATTPPEPTLHGVASRPVSAHLVASRLPRRPPRSTVQNASSPSDSREAPPTYPATLGSWTRQCNADHAADVVIVSRGSPDSSVWKSAQSTGRRRSSHCHAGVGD
jgi:hypothetical protein